MKYQIKLVIWSLLKYQKYAVCSDLLENIWHMSVRMLRTTNYKENYLAIKKVQKYISFKQQISVKLYFSLFIAPRLFKN